MTGRYRTWLVAKWDRDPFRSLTHIERYLYLAIHQGPYSTALPGVSVCGPAALAEAAGEVPDIQEHLAAMRSSGVLCQEGRVFVLPDVINETVPINPNQVKAWRTGFNELPEGSLKHRIDASIQELLIAHGEANPVTFKDGRPVDRLAYIHAWDPAFQKPSLNVPATLPERPADLARTSTRELTSVPETLAEPETEAGPETVSGPEAGSASGSGIGAREEKQIKVKSVVPLQNARRRRDSDSTWIGPCPTCEQVVVERDGEWKNENGRRHVHQRTGSLASGSQQ